MQKKKLLLTAALLLLPLPARALLWQLRRKPSAPWAAPDQAKGGSMHKSYR